jgi:hypothetical protein
MWNVIHLQRVHINPLFACSRELRQNSTPHSNLHESTHNTQYVASVRCPLLAECILCKALAVRSRRQGVVVDSRSQLSNYQAYRSHSCITWSSSWRSTQQQNSYLILLNVREIPVKTLARRPHNLTNGCSLFVVYFTRLSQ